MLASLSDSTYKQYDYCIRNWLQYCTKNKYDFTTVSVPIAIHFLTEVFDSGASYGTINCHKSALSLLLGSNLMNDNRIKRFMKGVFRLRPTRAKYNWTWNPSIVLNYLAQKWPNESLDLKTLSAKTLTLLALVSAHRVQTFSLIKLSNIKIFDSVEIVITIPEIIKTSKPNSYQPVLKLPYFQEKPEICPASCLQTYINKTSTLRHVGNQFLFISYKKPFSKLSTQRLSHWIKNTLKDSGINTSIFTGHSTRHAATSTANRCGVSIDVIRKTAGWTDSSKVFARFYNKEIIDIDFARSILNNL